MSERIQKQHGGRSALLLTLATLFNGIVLVGCDQLTDLSQNLVASKGLSDDAPYILNASIEEPTPDEMTVTFSEPVTAISGAGFTLYRTRDGSVNDGKTILVNATPVRALTANERFPAERVVFALVAKDLAGNLVTPPVVFSDTLSISYNARAGNSNVKDVTNNVLKNADRIPVSNNLGDTRTVPGLYKNRGDTLLLNFEDDDMQDHDPTNNLYKALDWLKLRAETNTDYYIVVTPDVEQKLAGTKDNLADVNRLYYQPYEQSAKQVSLTISGGSMSFSVEAETPVDPSTPPGNAGSLFMVDRGVTLILHDIILNGSGTAEYVRFNNEYSAITVKSGGTLRLQNNAKISGNSADAAVQADTILANRRGGGVTVLTDGSFIMEDGALITGNTAYSGGGVLVAHGGKFTMLGGDISNNTAFYTGGGVSVNGGTFLQKGGTISMNVASNATIVDLTPKSSFQQYGGGVHLTYNSSYTKTGVSFIADNEAETVIDGVRSQQLKNGAELYTARASSTNARTDVRLEDIVDDDVSLKVVYTQYASPEQEFFTWDAEGSVFNVISDWTNTSWGAINAPTP